MFSKKPKKETTTKKGIKNMDAIVTGAILSGVVASIYGVKKIRDARYEKNEISQIKEETKTQKKS